MSGDDHPMAAGTCEAHAAETPKPKPKRGFAALSREQIREIARKGGKAAHTAGTAHEFTSESARIAGRKGGQAVARRRKQAETP